MRLLLILFLCLTLLSAHAEDAPFAVRHGDRESPRIAITVDDCYDITHVQSVIDLCEEYGIVVTFFPIGKALKYADAPVWQEAVSIGCEIGNHTWGHKRMTNLTDHEVRFALLRTQQKVDALIGCHYPMQVMRPPLGKLDKPGIREVIADTGYLRAVLWDVSQTDAKKALKETENGSILLFHGRKKDVECLRALLPQLLEKGYEPVTVSELLGLPEIVPGGEMYVYKKDE